jgi:hypothetical protein
MYFDGSKRVEVGMAMGTRHSRTRRVNTHYAYGYGTKKIPIGIQMGKIYIHRVERVWVWDPKTHTRIPRYPSNSLTCGPLEYQRTKLIQCYYAQVWYL